MRELITCALLLVRVSGVKGKVNEEEVSKKKRKDDIDLFFEDAPLRCYDTVEEEEEEEEKEEGYKRTQIKGRDIRKSIGPLFERN